MKNILYCKFIIRDLESDENQKTEQENLKWYSNNCKDSLCAVSVLDCNRVLTHCMLVYKVHICTQSAKCWSTLLRNASNKHRRTRCLQ